MSIAVACPSCRTRLDAPDEAAGQSLPCPRCGASVAVPAVPPAPVQRTSNPGLRSAGAPPRYQPAQRDYPEDRGEYYPPPRDFARPGDGGNVGMAVAGLVLGIVGFVISFIPCVGWLFGIFLGILGATFSGIALGQGSGKGMALAGLILSILAIIWGPAFYFLIIAGIAGNLW